MTTTISSSMIFTHMTTTNNWLNLRSARPEDRDPLLVWCNTLWDGEEDYIGEVWDAWLAEGNLFVGTNAEQGDDTAIALLRMRTLSPAEAWFGGLRLHPSLQGRGGGRALIRAAEDWARQRGATSLGYMTETLNQRMHYLGEVMGYRTLGVYTWYSYAGTLTPAPLPPATALPAEPPRHSHPEGFYIFDWANLRLTPERLAIHRDAGELYAYGDAWLIAEMEPRWGSISHLQGPVADLAVIVAGLRAQQEPDAWLMAPIWDSDLGGEALISSLGFTPTTQRYNNFERTL